MNRAQQYAITHPLYRAWGIDPRPYITVTQRGRDLQVRVMLAVDR